MATFYGLKDFKERFSLMADEAIDEAQYQMLREGHRFAFKLAKRMSQRARATERRAGVKPPMADSWVQERPTRSGASRNVSSFKNKAPWANVIDEGRFRSTPGVGKARQVRQGRAAAAQSSSGSRMYGSPELPRGISRPVAEKLKVKAKSFAKTAIRRAEAKLK